MKQPAKSKVHGWAEVLVMLQCPEDAVPDR
jgi:hypothetical protein